ncbi:hypothetical protein OGAPHI_003953 [Ogataea philodendri]|uniref:Autophagy-related protein 27 n=1 Tax=Ogataea philodendri TaxID=1378263 RepID=A0A9P8T562_9ASCO|nr:uncharacterized protein OGAPHI_003953 [Ogataea philodendri]KAH3665765.1 hypothetical protein OGAPHI_003953 [Ogataea philodendri]
MFKQIYTVLFLLVRLTAAIDISDSHFAEYPDIKQLAGVHQVDKTEETPPSTKKLSWYVNIYDPSSKDSKNDLDVPECSKDSQVCGLTQITLPDRDPLVTEVFAFSNKLNPQFEDNSSSITVKLQGANWGALSLDTEIEFICGTEDTKDNLKLVSFDYSTAKFTFESKYACKSSQQPPKDGKEKSPKSDDSNSWGFFTWLFILLVIMMATYIIAQAWINTNRMGSSHEFLNELIESIIETLSKLPEFLREIGSKLFSSGNRGGYSAV